MMSGKTTKQMFKYFFTCGIKYKEKVYGFYIIKEFTWQIRDFLTLKQHIQSKSISVL